LDATPSPVLVERDASVAILTLNRPERLNAVSPDLYRVLNEALEQIESDTDVRAVVLTGAGRGFCVGADLKSHSEGPMSAEVRREYIALAQTVNASLQYSRVPVVAAVNGHAIGAGLELALSADFVLVAENAKLRLPEVALGTFVGGGVTYRLPRRVGDLKARELILAGDFFSGDEAMAMGLANRALPAENVLEAALVLARELAACAPRSMAQAKRLLNRSPDMTAEEALAEEADALDAIMETEDWAEGVRAFAEKRPPRFSGN
jgi:enoyl-CoA hydratase